MAKIYVTTSYKIYTIIDGVPTALEDAVRAGEHLASSQWELHLSFSYKNDTWRHVARVTCKSEIIHALECAIAHGIRNNDTLCGVSVIMYSAIDC